VVVVAILLGVGLKTLEYNEEFRHKFFANFCYQLAVAHSIPALDELRCDHLKDVSGPLVVELGPGPGTNFVCLKNNHNVKKWIGIEPNPHMQDFLYEQAKLQKVPFEVELKGIPGERLPLEDGSADSVVGTHLLCSVRNTTQVLNEISRILKPGGKYFFLEHIAAPNGTFLRTFQETIGPTWAVFGDGCRFQDTGADLDKLHDRLDVSYTHIEAPFPLPLGFVRPHIIGVATKKATATK